MNFISRFKCEGSNELEKIGVGWEEGVWWGKEGLGLREREGESE